MEIEKLIKNYAHDFRDIAMNVVQLEGVLIGFKNEIEKEWKERCKQAKIKTAEANYRRGLKETYIEIDKKMAEELTKEGEATAKIIEIVRQKAKQEVVDEVEKLITAEILICHHESTPTSRLTSLLIKLKQLIK